MVRLVDIFYILTLTLCAHIICSPIHSLLFNTIGRFRMGEDFVFSNRTKKKTSKNLQNGAAACTK